MASPTIARRPRGSEPADHATVTNGSAGSPASGRARGLRRVATALATAALLLGTLAPAALAVDKLTITTPYPAVVVAPGAHVSFNVSVSTVAADRVALTVGAPDAWKATIHGGTFVIDAVETNGTDAASVRIDVDVPADATGTTKIALKGTTATEEAILDMVVRVDATASGDIAFKTDFPSLRGPSTQTFNFNLTLANGTSEDVTYSVNAQGPTGWTVTANLTGQAQAASAVLKAGASAGVTVSALAPDGVAAGVYDLDVVAVIGDQTRQGKLQVEITGTYTLSLATKDGRLNGHGSAGNASTLAVNVTNTGTADIANVKLTGTGPSGWNVTFDTPTIASVAAGATVTVNAQIKASGDAIAGDYPVTISISGDSASRDSIEIRYTVETSLVWGVVGAALIVAVAGGVWFVFQRFGRR